MLRDANTVAGYIATIKTITEDYKAIGRKCKSQPTKQEVDALEASVLLLEAELSRLQPIQQPAAIWVNE